jgi:DNA-binding response OmpR family regulator
MRVPGPGIRKARPSRLRQILALVPLVLVGDSDPRLRRQLSALMRRKGYRVRVYNSALDLLQHFSENRGDLDTPELIVLGAGLGEQDALEVLGAMDMAFGMPHTIVLVPVQAAALREAAAKNGATLVVEQPQALAVLQSAVPDAQLPDWAVGDY